MVLATCKETAEMMVVRVSPGAELSGNAVDVNDRECDTGQVGETGCVAIVTFCSPLQHIQPTVQE